MQTWKEQNYLVFRINKKEMNEDFTFSYQY